MAVVSKIWEIYFPTFYGPFATAEPCSINAGPMIDDTNLPTGLIFKWQPGNEVAGDCVAPWGRAEIIIRKELAIHALEQFGGLKQVPVNALGTPRKKGARKKLVQPIEFAALWPTHWVSYDEEISTVGLQDSWVGMPLKSILGAQRIDLDFRSIPGKCIPIEYLRIPGKGMFIYKSKLENFQVFRVRQFPAKIHCSDQFRNFFIEHNVTNIVFLEVGDVIE